MGTFGAPIALGINHVLVPAPMSPTSIITSNKIGAGYSAPSAGRVFRGRAHGDPDEIRAQLPHLVGDQVGDGAKTGGAADRRRGFGLAAATDAFLRVSGVLRVACRNGQCRNGASTHAFPPIFEGQSSNRQLATGAPGAIGHRGGIDPLGGRARGGFPLSARALQPAPRRVGAAGISDEIALSAIGGLTALDFRARRLRSASGSGCGGLDPCEKSARGARFSEKPPGRGKVHHVPSDGAKGATLGLSRNRVN